MTRGLEMRVLDGVNTRSLASFWVGILCMGPMHWIREWGLAYGIYPWVSTLVMEIEGRRFWVERGCFFWGGRGRGRGTPGHDCRDVFAGRREFQTSLFMLYIIYFAVGVSLPRHVFRTPRRTWTDTCVVRLRQVVVGPGENLDTVRGVGSGSQDVEG